MNNALIPLLFKSFFKPFDTEFELLSYPHKSDKTEHTEQNGNKSNNGTEIGIDKTNYPIHSDLTLDACTILDSFYFGRQNRDVTKDIKAIAKYNNQ